ncbi:MAG: DNA recombination protein RmuC [Acidobacteriia bacterium]|nr:DNA recombination protein RmuC [Methyloceanibacter sp.]MBX5471061.1 DNA recombination protein RmuC [Acetobacteraceae bacterium]MCL6491395.1 DNA recombination protein RmuC [Terriglobia bacterium]
MLQLAAIIASLVTAAIALAILLRMIAQSRFWHEERLLLEQIRGGQRSETETLRTVLLAGQESARRELVELLGGMRDSLGRNHAELVQALASGQERVWRLMDEKLAELRRSTDQKLAEIQQTVNEQLHQAVEQQMTASFSRVTEQFALVQKAMGDVQAVTAQISDIKRIFSNVRTRGGWGETQLRALMDDVLPSGSYETNKRLRQDSDAVVEFAVIMPMRGSERTYLPIDAKFPVEDYERLLAASERGDVEAERAAQAGLIRRIREEARRIQEKYIVPPTTVEFAVMYLPTDGLYVEVARVPGLIDEIGRNHRVLVLGPSLFPALLRTIHLGHITLALEQKADEVRVLLGATRTEMEKMDLILAKLGKQAGTLSNTIETARQRTRAVRRKLRDVEAVDAETAERLLGVEAESADLEVEEPLRSGR